MSNTQKPNPELENLLLSFRRKIVDVCRKEGLQYDLTFTQAEIIRYIAPHGSVTMKSIADFLKISPPSATSMVSELEKKGAIERKEDKNDRRIVLISLTKKTEKVYSMMRKHKENVLQEMISKLSDQDKKTLERIINILIKD